MSNDRTIESYFAAMRRGAESEADMLDLFTGDAVYEEPFSGSTEPATGLDAVRERLRAGWANPLPDMELDVIEVRIEGDSAEARWECRSPALDTPVRGSDQYTFRDGKIARLKVAIDDR